MRALLRRRAVHGALLIVLLTAGWSASAGALPPPPITLPTVTLPIVTVPPVTVPPVTTPVVTTPAVTTPAVTTPTLPPQAPPLPRVPRGTPPARPPDPSVRRSPTDGATDRTGDRTGETIRGGRAETSREQASRLRLARGGARRATLLFSLSKPGPVELDVQQLAPDCRRVGRFRVRGHRGVNRVRLRTRLRRRRLAPGTYSVVVRTAQRTVGRLRFVVDRTHEGEVRIARGVNVCGRKTAVAATETTPPPTAAAVPKQPNETDTPRHHRRALGARFVRGLGIGNADDVPLWAYALVAFAVALLGTAAVIPRTKARLSSALLLAFVGAGIILLLTLAYALG